MINQPILKKSFLTTTFVAVFFSIFFSACDKQTTPLPYADIAAFLKTKETPSQTFSVNPTTTQTITGAQGTKITFYVNSFKDAAGNLVTTPVTVEMKEIFKKGDMIWSNRMTESNGSLLESGGEFFLKATANGQTVFLNQPYNMTVPIVPATSNPMAMNLFEGVQLASDTFTWVPADSVWVNVDTVGNTGGGGSSSPVPNYNFNFDEFNWINCDYFWYSNNNTHIQTRPIAQNVTLTSIQVYLVFSNLNSVLRLYSSNSTTYESSNVPIGLPATIVIIGMDGTQLYLGTQNITITNNTPIDVMMSPASEAQITSTINNL